MIELISLKILVSLLLTLNIYSSVSIVNFEQINARWVCSISTKKEKVFYHSLRNILKNNPNENFCYSSVIIEGRFRNTTKSTI